MAGRLAVAYVDLKLRMQEYTTGLREALTKLKSFNKEAIERFRKTGQQMKRIGSRMTLFITTPLTLIARKMVNVASNVEEQMAKFEAVFKEAAPEVLQWAQSYSTAVKRSQYDLVEWLAVLQDTFIPLGYSRAEAAEFSKALVTLAIDLASFNNKAEPDVINDLQSALTGMTRSMYKYGVIIRENDTKQKAYQMGTAKVGREISNRAKVEARLQLILEGTKDAQGDAIRTADSFVNTMKDLQAATKDLSKAFGDLTKDALKPAVKWLANYIRQLEQGTTASKLFAIALGAIASSLGPILMAGGGLAMMISTLMKMNAAAKLASMAQSLALMAMYHPALAAGAVAAAAGTYVIPQAVRGFRAGKEAEGKWAGLSAPQKERQLAGVAGKRPTSITFLAASLGTLKKALEEKTGADNEEREALRRKCELLNTEEQMRNRLLALIPQEERKRTQWLEKEMMLVKGAAAAFEQKGIAAEETGEWISQMESRLLDLYDKEKTALKELGTQRETATKTLREMAKSWMTPIQQEIAAMYARAREFRKTLGNDIRIKKWTENEKLKIAKRAIEEETGLLTGLGETMRAVWDPQWMGAEDIWKRGMAAARQVTYTTTPAVRQADLLAKILNIQRQIYAGINKIVQAEEHQVDIDEQDRAMGYAI